MRPFQVCHAAFGYTGTFGSFDDALILLRPSFYVLIHASVPLTKGPNRISKQCTTVILYKNRARSEPKNNKRSCLIHSGRAPSSQGETRLPLTRPKGLRALLVCVVCVMRRRIIRLGCVVFVVGWWQLIEVWGWWIEMGRPWITRIGSDSGRGFRMGFFGGGLVLGGSS